MKENKLTIKINKPTSEVFQFTLNPKNTPKWIDSIVKEETSEWPVEEGSIYRNKDKKGEWSEYELTELEEDKMFVLTAKNGNYYVKYTLTPIDEESCRFEYYEWVDEGTLDNPFKLDTLKKLKTIIEK